MVLAVFSACFESARAQEISSVEQSVERIVKEFGDRGSYSSSCPQLQELIALGVDALPYLFELERQLYRRDSTASYPKRLLLIDAVSELMTDADVPRVVQIVGEGDLDFCRALEARGGGRVRDGVIAVCKKGTMGPQLVRVADLFRSEESVRSALCGWVVRNPGHWYAGGVCEWLGREGVSGANAACEAVLSESRFVGSRALAVIGLIRLGSVAALKSAPSLIASGEVPLYELNRLEDELNCVAQRRIFGRSAYEADRAAGRVRARREFDEWWAEFGEAVRFDAPSRSWQIPGTSRSRGGPAATWSEALLRRVQVELIPRYGVRGALQGSHAASRIEGLGRSAVPVLIELAQKEGPWSTNDLRREAILQVVALALDRLREPADSEAISQLVRSGFPELAQCLRSAEGLNASSREVLSGLISKGFATRHVMSELGRVPFSEDVGVGLRAWRRTGDGDDASCVAEYIRGLGACERAAPLLREFASDRKLDPEVRQAASEACRAIR